MSETTHYHFSGVTGAQETHSGLKESCKLPDCTLGPAVSPESRLRLFLAINDAPDISGEIVYDPRFNTEDWPRQAYAFRREDVEHVLSQLNMARMMRDTNANRTDDKTTEYRAILKVLMEVSKDLKESRKEAAGLETKLIQAEGVIESLKRNGGEHWYVFGYQKDLNAGAPDSAQNWVDYCQICDLPKDHSRHFASGTSATDVTERVMATRARMTDMFLTLGFGPTTALATAMELLGELPGAKDWPPLPKEQDLYGRTPEQQKADYDTWKKTQEDQG